MAYLNSLMSRLTLSRLLLAVRKGLLFVGYLLRTPVKFITGVFMAVALVGIFFSWFIFNDSAFAWNMAKLWLSLFAISFGYDFILGLLEIEKD